MFARIHDALVRAYLPKEEGQTMAEYGLILAAVAVVAFGAFQLLEDDITALLGDAGDQMNP